MERHEAKAHLGRLRDLGRLAGASRSITWAASVEEHPPVLRSYDQSGRRIDEVAGGRVQLLLTREDVEGPWGLRLNVEDSPDADALHAIVREAVDVAEASGLAVTRIRERG